MVNKKKIKGKKIKDEKINWEIQNNIIFKTVLFSSIILYFRNIKKNRKSIREDVIQPLRCATCADCDAKLVLSNIPRSALGSTSIPLSTNSYIRALSWGGNKWNWSQEDTTKLCYWFGGATSAGERWGYTTTTWTEAEKDAMVVGLETWTNIIGMDVEEDMSSDGSGATLKWYVTDDSNYPYLGQHGPPGTSSAGFGLFKRYSGGTWTDTLNPGGFGFITIVHEIGHGLGLAHPHDTGGGSTLFPGVTSSSSTGDNALNQNTFTVMSYNDRGQAPYNPSGYSYGYCKGPMAFDIATVKYLYGLSSSYNSGDTTYTITDTNSSVPGAGSGYQCIYDTGGTNDLIIYNGSNAVTIYLGEATIQNESGGGGFVSKIDDSTIYTGLTISQGSVIENATTGGGDDTIYQAESVSNIIRGNDGSDTVIYANNFIDYTVEDKSSGDDGTEVWVTKKGTSIKDELYNIEILRFADGDVNTNDIKQPEIDYSLYSSSPGLTINASNTILSDSIVIPDGDYASSQIIQDIVVVIDEIIHTWVGDLKITLINDDTEVVLMNLAGSGTWGSSGDNFISTIISDSGIKDINSITFGDSPHSGTYFPSNDGTRTYLSDFDGKSINSTWTLKVEDTYPSLDDGLFVKWSLRIKPKKSSQIPPAIMSIYSEDITSGSLIYSSNLPTDLYFSSSEVAPSSETSNNFELADINVTKDGGIVTTADYLQDFKKLDTDGNETVAPSKNYKVTFNTTEKGVYAFYVSSGAYNYDYSGGGTGINNESNTFTFEYSSKPIIKGPSGNTGDKELLILVGENTTTVGTWTEEGGSTVGWSLTGNAREDNSLFSINSSSGIVTFNSSPDFENPSDANTDNKYEIGIQAQNSITGESSIQDVTVSILNIDDTAPTGISLSNYSVVENSSIGTTIGTLTTDDVDSINIHTYTLVSGDGDTNNNDFYIDGTILKTSTIFTGTGSKSIRIRSTLINQPVRTIRSTGYPFESIITVNVSQSSGGGGGGGGGSCVIQ